MPEFSWKSVLDFVVAGVVAIFTTIVSTLKASYEASHKWFAVGCIIFLALVWFGWAHLPTFSAKDEGLSKQISSLSNKMDAMASEIDGLRISLDTLKDIGPSKVTTGSIKRHK